MGEEKGERKRKKNKNKNQEPGCRRSLPHGSLAHSFTTEHIKHWIKAVLQGSWQLREGAARTVRTLFRQNLAEVAFKCGANPESKSIFQHTSGVRRSGERDHLHGRRWENAVGTQTLGSWGTQEGEQSPQKRADTWVRVGKVARRPRQPFLQELVERQACLPQPFPPLSPKTWAPLFGTGSTSFPTLPIARIEPASVL